MKLKKETIKELGPILKEEFVVSLNNKDLDILAHSLVGYFDLLLKIENRHKFGNRSGRVIDNNGSKQLDKKE